MKKILVIFISIFIGFSLISCTNQEKDYDVYVTVYPMKFVTERIFEGTGYTVGIVPGVTSHENSVDWSPKEIIAMTEATYLFYVGANYDQYIDYQINSIFIDKDVQLVKVEDQTDYIQFIEGVIDNHDEEIPNDSSLGTDPHFWVSPLKVIQITNLIYDKLVLKFDDSNFKMRNNYNKLIDDLEILSDAFQEVISNANKIAMTSTNIYGYLRDDYGFNYISISPGYHEETEQFTSQEKEEIVNHAIENNIKYIIYEKYTSSPLSNAVFDELDNLNMDPIKLEFHILQSLTDEDIANGDDYITVMYDNLELLKLALDYQEE
ncbi:MAG: hypothetical protein B6I17_01805 [Tenericutes bacterium 4572_104]|nr:MAG: hypothetical protein B6I17_01805 [Tenericutes bacterium 4572_104]